MNRTVKIALHVLLQYGFDVLDQAYHDLPADRRAEPHVRQVIEALDELDDALNANLFSIVNSKIADRSDLDLKPIEEPVSKLAAAWSIAPEGLRQDEVVWRWRQQCARRDRIARRRGSAVAEKKQRHVQR
jgi:hypothetical protein